MNKKIKMILICLIFVVLIPIFFLVIDYNRITQNLTPLFCIKTADYEDGGSTEYTGLGYKIINFNMLNGYNEIKVGNVFMKYDDFSVEIEKYKYNQLINQMEEEIRNLANENYISK